MEDFKIQRINVLAQKAKTPEGLTPEEKEEQKALRAEYIAGFRRSLEAQLKNTTVVEPDGTRYPLSSRKKPGKEKA